MDASSRDILFYKSGIIDTSECSKHKLDHSAIAVGYDLTGEIPYLIVKNR